MSAPRRDRAALALTGMLFASVLAAAPAPADAQPASELCDPADTEQFSDVDTDDYAAGHILCLKTLGITKGKTATTFGPEDKLTRAQMAALLVRLWSDVLGFACPAAPHPFKDIPKDHYAASHIACLYSLGITKGKTATTYAPDEGLTTAQITRFIARLWNKSDDDPVSPENRCKLTGNDELDAAAACLTSFNVAASLREAKSSAAATRAQIAVYVIGVWRYITGRGKPPKPPVYGPVTSAADGTAVHYSHIVVGGGGHSCGLRTDGAVECWGGNHDGQAAAPPGEFTTVSAGRDHSCGVRVDKTVVCWGDNAHKQATAPSGKFTTVSSGFGHSCGVRVDGAVECWGSNHDGQATAPPGEFTTVSAGRDHSCGVRVDKTVFCWGSTRRGEADAPPGEFTTASSGFGHSCGVRVDGSVECWGDNRTGQTDAPPGEFTTVSAGRGHSCGVRVDGSVECWG